MDYKLSDLIISFMNRVDNFLPVLKDQLLSYSLAQFIVSIVLLTVLLVAAVYATFKFCKLSIANRNLGNEGVFQFLSILSGLIVSLSLFTIIKIAYSISMILYAPDVYFISYFN